MGTSPLNKPLHTRVVQKGYKTKSQNSRSQRTKSQRTISQKGKKAREKSQRTKVKFAKDQTQKVKVAKSQSRKKSNANSQNAKKSKSQKVKCKSQTQEVKCKSQKCKNALLTHRLHYLPDHLFPSPTPLIDPDGADENKACSVSLAPVRRLITALVFPVLRYCMSVYGICNKAEVHRIIKR